MKLYKLSILALATVAGFASCNDFLEQEPPSSLTPEGFFSTADKVQAAANRFYQDVLPNHGGWDYGQYTADNNTDNQTSLSPDNKFGNDLWRVSNTNDDWAWTNVRNINYQLSTIIASLQGGVLSESAEVKQYLGEIYFFRAWAYFDLLKKFGDLPIIKEALPDDEAALVAASNRQPCNEVARFILSDLDEAIKLMDGYSAKTTRINADAARVFKSRVALYMGSWLTNFQDTPFVPNGPEWPGKAKNASYAYPSGNAEAEAKWFLNEAASAGKAVADKFMGKLTVNTGKVPQSLDDPANPYMEIWGTTDCSKKDEVLLWRQYSQALGVKNNVEVAAQKGNIGTGFTRSLVESYLMADGKPIYASAFTYDDTTISAARQNRDPRFTVFFKEPGQVNCFKNVADPSGTHWNQYEDIPSITTKQSENGYYTGYSIRKGGTFDRQLCPNGGSYNVLVLIRATEAFLNYMEADYMVNKSLANILPYWTAVRTAAGFEGAAADPQTTIAATDMQRESGDWGAYTAGKLLTDVTLYNIRRERRCEFLAEGMRDMDLRRWRSFDQLCTTPAHIEGIHLWAPAMLSFFEAGIQLPGKSTITTIKLTAADYDGSSNATVSSPSLSEYLRPLEVNLTNNNFKDGLKWHMAHYLQPLPLRQFILTADDHATIANSPLYQNPYWPIEVDKPAVK